VKRLQLILNRTLNFLEQKETCAVPLSRFLQRRKGSKQDSEPFDKK